MNKNNVILLISGIVLYSIGFIYLSIIGLLSMMFGGILLGLFLVNFGIKLRNSGKAIGNVLKIFGTIFIGLVVIVSIGMMVNVEFPLY